MLISQALAHAKAITGSAFSDAEALRWLGELDGKLALDFYGADAFAGYTGEDAGSALLVPWPWDGLYVHFLESMIYYSNGEYDRSRNARAMYEKMLDDFRKALRRKCCPVTPDQMSTQGGSAVTVVTASEESPWFYLSAYALAVKHGFQGTEEEWLESIGHTVVIPMDDVPTPGSENAVKSGGLYTALTGKQDALTFDVNPTRQSNNPVYSGGVYAGFETISQNFSAAMQQMDARKQNVLTFDSEPTFGSGNPVTSHGVADALGELDTALWAVEVRLNHKQDALTFDTAPTAGSANPVTSGGVHTALAGKQDALTFDTAPIAGSANPVTSGGVHTALSGKQDALTFDTAPTAGSANPVTSGGVYSALAEAEADMAEGLADLNPPQTASGSVVTFTSAAAGNPVNPLIVNIEPAQSGSGDPSPDNVRPITGWTGANITVSPTQDAQDGTVYSISFGSAGTVYGGTLDVARGLLTVDRAIVDLGTLNHSYDSTGKYFWLANFPNVIRNGNAETARILSDRFRPVSRNYFFSNETVDGLIAINSSKTLIIRWLAYTVPADFKAAVSGSLLVYTLAAPSVYQLTPQEVKTLLGVNNLWADCGGVSATYRTGSAAPVLTASEIGVAGGAAAYNDVMARLAALEAAVTALGGNI